MVLEMIFKITHTPNFLSFFPLSLYFVLLVFFFSHAHKTARCVFTDEFS